MFGLRIIAIVMFGILGVKPALAQTLPSCFSIASDPDGDGFGWENDASCVITTTSLRSPSFTNLETGNPVNLVRAQWSVSDFADNEIVCTPHRFDGAVYSTFGASTPLYVFQSLSQTAPYNGNVVVHGDTVITQTWTLNNGIYFGPSILAATPWVEIIDQERILTTTQNATRVWLTNESYSVCSNIHPLRVFVPSASLQTDIDNCDYTSAALFDGWGWDAIAGQSCPPIDSNITDNCDYTNAAQFDGWGWNAVTGQSCEPLTSTSVCIDSDGDGWGWDGTQSCRLE